MSAKQQLMQVYAKINALKDEYRHYFAKVHGHDARWIYSQNFGVEAMKGLVDGLKLDYKWKLHQEKATQ
jgi:hypothetical protein